MTINGYLQLILYVVVLLALCWPLGGYMARVYQGDVPAFMAWLRPLERGLCRLAGVRRDDEMTWTRYAGAALTFNLLGFLAV